MKKTNPVALVILDGFGYSPHTYYNAIAQAKKPFLDFAFKNFPHTLLDASGPAVGLPPGYAGNSEVGHTTLGAGARIPSAFLRLTHAINDGSFFSNPVLVHNLQTLAQSGKTLHLLGVLSDAGVHGHMDIILATIQAALEQNAKKIVIHGFLDGQDVPPQSAAFYLDKLQKLVVTHSNIVIGSITGRWYAMDRNNHTERTGATYTMLTHGQKTRFDSWQEALSYYYHSNINDMFIPPTLFDNSFVVRERDGIIFTNFRKERERQLVNRFLTDGPELAFLISPVQYDPTFTNQILLAPPAASGTLKEKISNAGKTIFSIAETEKYAHVTFFFDGATEQPFPGETRTLIPSPAVQNFADAPELSAQKITDAVLTSLRTKPSDFYLINYANADLVGHSGNYESTVAAIECLDHQLKQLYEQIVIGMNGTLIITADHGKAEKMRDEKTGLPFPGHTSNKVPLILIAQNLEHKKKNLEIHELADVAGLVLKLLSL